MIEYRQWALVRIALANSIGFSASTAVPLWVGSLGERFALPTWGPGAIATGQLVCAALLNAATPWLFRGAHPRRLAAVAAMVSLCGNLLAVADNPGLFVCGCLLCGAGLGIVLNVTNHLIAGSKGPQRGYAVVQVVEVLFCTAFFLGVPAVVQPFGVRAVFVVLAGLCVLVLPLLARIPIGLRIGQTDVSTRNTPGHHPAGSNTAAAVMSLMAIALLFAGQSSINSSLVLIGASSHLDVLWVGRVMALGLLASLVGAVLARGLGEHLGLLMPLLSCAGLLAVDFLGITVSRAPLVFVGCTIVLCVGTVFLIPYMFTLLAGLDRSGRWASIGPGFLLIGVALGPGIAGLIARAGDFSALGAVAALLVGISMALFVGGYRARRTYLSATHFYP